MTDLRRSNRASGKKVIYSQSKDSLDDTVEDPVSYLYMLWIHPSLQKHKLYCVKTIHISQSALVLPNSILPVVISCRISATVFK